MSKETSYSKFQKKQIAKQLVCLHKKGFLLCGCCGEYRCPVCGMSKEHYYWFLEGERKGAKKK